MSAINVLASTTSRIKEIMKDVPLKTDYNNPEPFKVHQQVLPERMNNDFDYSEEKDGKNMYPFAVVQLVEGEKKGNHSPMNTRIMVIIGIHNEKLDGNGYDDVIVAIDAIMNDLNVTPYIDNRFIIDDEAGLKWSLNEDNTHPFYFGGLEFTLQSATLTNNRGGMPDD